MRCSKFFKNRVLMGLAALALGTQSVLSSGAFAQAAFYLPPAGAMVTPRGDLQPALMMGVIVHPEDPFAFDFLISRGDDRLADPELEFESQRLIKYFLAALTVPEDDMWVNLSPYEPDRIIPTQFGYTEMGRDMLAQDYLLKQLAASLMHPEEGSGQQFWQRVRERTQQEFGLADFPAGLLSRIWIVPARAVVYEHDNGAFVVSRELRVMTEEDYVRSPGAAVASPQDETDGCQDSHCQMMTEIVREILIPELEHEVNHGEIFANLRQIFNSMILAAWYKQALRETLLGRMYIDRQKVKGVEYDSSVITPKTARDVASVMPSDEEPARGDTEAIYDQYLAAFQKGVFNFVKEDYDPVAQQIIPRKYFSGGVTAGRLSDGAMVVLNAGNMGAADPAMAAEVKNFSDDFIGRAERGDLVNVSTRFREYDLKREGRSDSGEIEESVLDRREMQVLLQIVEKSVRREPGFTSLRQRMVFEDIFRDSTIISNGGYLRSELDLRQAVDILSRIIGREEARKSLFRVIEDESLGQLRYTLDRFFSRVNNFGGNFFGDILEKYSFITDIGGHQAGRNFEIAAESIPRLPSIKGALSSWGAQSREARQVLVEHNVLSLVMLHNFRPLPQRDFSSMLLLAFCADYDPYSDNADSRLFYGIPLIESMTDFATWLTIDHELGHVFFAPLSDVRENGIIAEMVADITSAYMGNYFFPESYDFESYLQGMLKFYENQDGGQVVVLKDSVFNYSARTQLLELQEALGKDLDFRNLFLSVARIEQRLREGDMPEAVLREIKTARKSSVVSVVEFTKFLILEYLRTEGYRLTLEQEISLMATPLKHKVIKTTEKGILVTPVWEFFNAHMEIYNYKHILDVREIRNFIDSARNLARTEDRRESSSDRAMGSPTRMATAPKRLAASNEGIAKFLGLEFPGERLEIIDVGVGWSPVTTEELSGMIGENGRVIGVDSQLPAYVLKTPEALVLFDKQKRVLSVQRGSSFETGETISDRLRSGYETTLNTLLNSGRNEDENGNFLEVNPVARIEGESLNLKLVDGNLFDLRSNEILRGMPQAHLVRIANVIFPHYEIADVERALFQLLPFVRDNGFVMIGRSDPMFPVLGREEYLVYRKQEGGFDFSGYAFGLDIVGGSLGAKAYASHVLQSPIRNLDDSIWPLIELIESKGEASENRKNLNKGIQWPVQDEVLNYADSEKANEASVREYESLRDESTKFLLRQLIEKWKQDAGGREVVQSWGDMLMFVSWETLSVASGDLSVDLKEEIQKEFFNRGIPLWVDAAMTSEAAELLSSDWSVLKDNLLERWAEVLGAARGWEAALIEEHPQVDFRAPEQLTVDGIMSREDLSIFIYGARHYVQYVRNQLTEMLNYEQNRLAAFDLQTNDFLSLLTIAEESLDLSASGKLTGSGQASAAMTADDSPSVEREVGGIDFNPSRMDLEIRRDDAGRPLPVGVPTLAEDSIEGFYPVIINITPVFNPLPLLGMGEPSPGDFQHAFHG